MNKQVREGLAALCVAGALLLVGVVAGVVWVSYLGTVAAVLALGAIAVGLARPRA